MSFTNEMQKEACEKGFSFSGKAHTGENSLSSPGGYYIGPELCRHLTANRGQSWENYISLDFSQWEMIRPLIILVVESGFSVTYS